MTQFDPRETAVQALWQTKSWFDIIDDRTVQSSASMLQEPRPFCVVKIGIDAELARWRQGPREMIVELWIHDQPGDYAQIDALGELAKTIYAGIQSTGRFVESRFISSSQDLEDPELGTIFRVFRFQWTTSS